MPIATKILCTMKKSMILSIVAPMLFSGCATHSHGRGGYDSTGVCVTGGYSLYGCSGSSMQLEYTIRINKRLN